MDRLWSFVADMNGDGAITISDVWLWVKWLYFYPGDVLLSVFIGHPITAKFFELSAEDYGGITAGIFSFIGWIAVLGVISTAIDDYRNK